MNVRKSGPRLSRFSRPTPPVKAVRAQAQAMLAALFDAYRADPDRLREEWRPLRADPTKVARTSGDFIAGMTERHAVRRDAELVGPSALPESFAVD